MQHWFVYYKLDPPTARAIESCVRGMQREIAAAGEVYDGIDRPETFAGVLEAAVARAGLPATLLAQRRAERFEEL